MHCGQLFDADPRSRQRQQYCSLPAFQQASKAAIQQQWLEKAENRDYWRGPEQVERVRAWRKANPNLLHPQLGLEPMAGIGQVSTMIRCDNMQKFGNFQVNFQ